MVINKTKTDFKLPDFADHPAMREFLSAWDDWRGDNTVPNRSNVKLNDISSFMSHTMLLDMVSPSEIICRYIGSIFMDIYAKDFTGQNYLDLTESQFREMRSKRLSAVVNQPCVAAWTTKTDMGGGQTAHSVGLSLPIIPTVKDAPMQLMQTLVFSVPVPRSEYGKPTRFQHLEFSNRFETIDIGAGHPVLD